MLVDRYGRPLRAPTKDELETEQAVPTLGSVRQIATGHPAEGLEPLRLAAILHSAETGDATAYLELAEQMEEKDLHYAAVLGVRKRAIRSLELKVEPGAEDDTAAQEAADLVRDALHGPAVRTSLIGILDAIGKGYSVSELIWDRSGPRWTIAGIERVDPRWFEFDDLTGRQLRLRGLAGGEELRPWKFVVHFAEAKSGLPIRGGLARLAAWGFMFKHFTIRDWAIFTEAYGHPLRIGKYDPALASAQDKATLLRAVRSMGTDMAAIIPNNMLVDIIATAVSGTQELYERTARYWDEQISKGVLGQVATTDAIAGGHAVGKIHEEVRGDIRDADADDLAATLMRDVATPLTQLNFPPGTPVPVIRFEPPERVDPEQLLKLMEIAGPAGLRIAHADIYRAFALREPSEGEEVLAFSPAPPVMIRPGAPAIPAPERALALPSPGRRELAARSADDPHDDAITDAIDEMIAGGGMQQRMDGLLDELLEGIRSAESPEAALELVARFEARAPDADLRDLLARAIFGARVAADMGADLK